MKSNGNIFIRRDTCFVCGICVETCIMDNLRMYLAPCRNACPLHLNAQGYVRLIAQKKEEDAARLLRSELPFAGIVGRVCSRPCEDLCERSKIDGQAVHILALKRYLADKMPDIIHRPAEIAEPRGKKVAVVGSGPAGLMAAHDLAEKGYSVTVFESAPEPGGMLRLGIPEFRLPAVEVSRAIEMLEKMKIQFKTGRTLGKDLETERLEREWDAVFLALGAPSPIKLGIPGEGSEGVYQGIRFLCELREGKNPPVRKSVIVIGGGNTSVDAALACRKLGVDDVTIVCLEAIRDMPAFRSELDQALEEGVKVHDGWGPTRISRNDDRLTVEFSRCLRVFDDTGSFRPELEKTCGLAMSADAVLVAVGQRPDSTSLPSDLVDPESRLPYTNPVTMQTRHDKVFAGGDLAFGTQSVVHAMAQGREAAVSIDRFLQGEKLEWGRQYWDGICITDFPVDRSRAAPQRRLPLDRIPLDKRTLGAEVIRTLRKEDAESQAERCLNCGFPAETNKTCWSCLPCEIECPVNALEVRMPYLIR